MKTLYIMCAAPGAGKTTFIKNHIAKLGGYTAIESRDDVRFSLVKEGEEYFSKENEVFRRWINNIKLDLATPGVQNVFADATHISAGSRKKLIGALRGTLTDVRIVCIVIDTCLAKCLSNNELRKGTRSYVPEEVIRNMFAKFEMPSFDEEIDEIMIYRDKSMVIKERT